MRSAVRSMNKSPKAAEQTVGLRERQRRLGEEAILDAAIDLFNHKGYAKTTMQMIADAAGVGVATVFRHFRSKAGVVAGLMRRDCEDIFQRGRAVVAKPHDDPVAAVVELLVVMLAAWDLPSSRLRGFSRIWLATQTGHPDTDALVSWADAELLRMIREQLEGLQGRGLLSPKLDAGDMSVVVFCVFNQHYIGLAAGNGPSLGQVSRELRRRIPLLFVSWIGDAPRKGTASRK